MSADATMTSEELEALKVRTLSPDGSGEWRDRVAITRADYNRLRATARASSEDRERLRNAITEELDFLAAHFGHRGFAFDSWEMKELAARRGRILAAIDAARVASSAQPEESQTLQGFHITHPVEARQADEERIKRSGLHRSPEEKP